MVEPYKTGNYKKSREPPKSHTFVTKNICKMFTLATNMNFTIISSNIRQSETPNLTLANQMVSMKNGKKMEESRGIGDPNFAKLGS